MSIFSKIKNAGLEGIINAGKNLIDELITSKEEAAQKKIEWEQTVNSHVQKMRELELQEDKQILDDRSSARDMFKANNALQKIYAVTFLIAYIILATSLLYVAVEKPVIPEYAQILMSTIFGSMTTKISTITDFLFGSSLGSHVKDAR